MKEKRGKKREEIQLHSDNGTFGSFYFDGLWKKRGIGAGWHTNGHSGTDRNNGTNGHRGTCCRNGSYAWSIQGADCI